MEMERKMKNKKLISYALSFVSFVLPKVDVEEVILFGSVARGEVVKKSDVDLFFNVDEKKAGKLKEIVEGELSRFYKSKVFEMWRLRGIDNQINFEVGNLDKWKLKRSVISEGIVLFGKYRGVPEGKEGYVHFNVKPIKDIARRNRIIRILFGRGEKGYSSKGLLEDISGKKLSPSSFVVPIGKVDRVLDVLKKEKIDYTFFEFWTDRV